MTTPTTETFLRAIVAHSKPLIDCYYKFGVSIPKDERQAFYDAHSTEIERRLQKKARDEDDKSKLVSEAVAHARSNELRDYYLHAKEVEGLEETAPVKKSRRTARKRF